MKKFISLLLCLSVLIAGITGCNNKLNPNNPVTLTMWHNYGGEMQQMMDLLIDEFNATIGKEKGKEAAKTIVFLPAALSALPVFKYNKIDGIWKEERE